MSGYTITVDFSKVISGDPYDSCVSSHQLPPASVCYCLLTWQQSCKSNRDIILPSVLSQKRRWILPFCCYSFGSVCSIAHTFVFLRSPHTWWLQASLMRSECLYQPRWWVRGGSRQSRRKWDASLTTLAQSSHLQTARKLIVKGRGTHKDSRFPWTLKSHCYYPPFFLPVKSCCLLQSVKLD